MGCFRTGSAGRWAGSRSRTRWAGTESTALVWVYSKDSGSESGSDRGWVDYLQWTPSAGGGSSTTDWQQITYTYDPSGRRIAKDVDGVGHSSRGRSSRLRWTCST